MDKTRLVTNITDLLECREIKDFMSVNGFAWDGSAYNRFHTLCICAERQPDAPVTLRMQAYLKEMLGENLPINPSTCQQIWKETSNRIFLGEVSPRTFPDAEDGCIQLPSSADLTLEKCFLLNHLRVEADGWTQWREKAEEVLCRILDEGGIVSVELPEDGSFEKTSLYKANRAIVGREWDCPSWICQLVYFLCDFCAANGTRAGIICPSDGAELLEILQHVSKLTRLPNLYVGTSQSNSESMLPVCRLVLSQRERSENGVPPVILFSPN